MSFAEELLSMGFPEDAVRVVATCTTTLEQAVELLCTEDFASTAGASGPPGLPRSTVEEPSRVPEEMRTWTPLRLQLPKVVPPELFGAARGTPFEGTLVRLQGLSNERSKEMVVLRLPDGRLRGWTLGSFGPEDAAYVDTTGGRSVLTLVCVKVGPSHLHGSPLVCAALERPACSWLRAERVVECDHSE
eukprot:gene11742-13866_t